jgi:hypothetical protein
MFMMCHEENDARSVVKIILCQLCHVQEQSTEQWKNFSDEEKENSKTSIF